MGVLPAANPGNPDYGDQDRYVGNGTGASRVTPSGCVRIAALALGALVFLLVCAMLGLALMVGVATLLIASDTAAALLAGVGLLCIVGLVVMAIAAYRGRLP